MSASLITQLATAKLVSTPICVIRTADPAGTMEAIKAMKLYPPAGKKEGLCALLRWDIVNGLMAVDREGDTAKPGEKALKACLRDKEPAASTNPVEALQMLEFMPPGGMCFFLNAHRFMEDAGVSQAIWNRRDDFKATMRMLVLLCPSITLPAELQQDVLVLDEPLPTDVGLKALALAIYRDAGFPAPDSEFQERIVDATLGLAAFPAEQAMAMSLDAETQSLSIENLWQRKRQLINGNPGLSVWAGGEKFADIGGCENIKTFLRDVLNGEQAPRSIVFCDEIEKGVGGSSGDTSGVGQAQMGQLLTWMQDNEANGVILVGIPGTAKSAIAKAAGNEAGIPTIALDIAGTKNSLVGESEARLRNALAVIDAVSQKRALWLATCNSLAILPPELKRRFTMGVFYFDLPSNEEKAAIWKIYRKKYNLPASYEIPDDTDWTGAEIKQCAALAWRLRRSLVDAAAFVVPVAKSAPEQVEKLRTQADGRFISVSYPGTYCYTKEKAVPAGAGTGRRMIKPNVN